MIDDINPSTKFRSRSMKLELVVDDTDDQKTNKNVKRLIFWNQLFTRELRFRSTFIRSLVHLTAFLSLYEMI